MESAKESARPGRGGRRRDREIFCETKILHSSRAQVSSRPAQIRRHDAADDLGLHHDVGLEVRGWLRRPSVSSRMRASHCRQKIWAQSRRAGFHSIHGRVHRVERSAAQRVDGSLRRHRRPDARFVRRVRLQFDRRSRRHSDFLRARLVRLFSEPV